MFSASVETWNFWVSYFYITFMDNKEQFCQLSIIKQTRLRSSADSLDDMSWFTGTDSKSLTFSRVAHQTEGISSSRPASSGGFTCISTGNLILSNVAKVKETNGNQPHIVCCKSLTELHRQVYGMLKIDEGNLLNFHWKTGLFLPFKVAIKWINVEAFNLILLFLRNT